MNNARRFKRLSLFVAASSSLILHAHQQSHIDVLHSENIRLERDLQSFRANREFWVQSFLSEQKRVFVLTSQIEELKNRCDDEL